MDEEIDFKCSKCGRIHSKTWRNFKDWLYCKKCDIYICPHCSNLSNMKNIQTLFLYNIVSFLLFYFAIWILRMPFDPASTSSINPVLATVIFLVLSAFSFFSYALLYYFSSRRNLKRASVVSTCPKCQGKMNIYDRDFIVQFWFTLMLMTTILSFVFQMFYQIFYSYSQGIPYPPYDFVIIPFLVELIIFVIMGLLGARLMYKGTFSHHRKKTYRSWLSILYFYLLLTLLSASTLILVKVPGTEFTFDFIFQSLSSITWMFPYFLITAFIHVLLKNFMRERHHFLLKITCFYLIFIAPFFILVFLGTLFPTWDFIMSGIISGFIVGFLLLISLFSALFFLPNSNLKTMLKTKKNMIYLSGVAFLLVLAIMSLILRFFIIPPFITQLSQVGSMVLLCVIILGELREHWSNNDGQFFKLIENKMGQESYTILLAFFIVSLLNFLMFFVQFFGISPHLTISNWTPDMIYSISLSVLCGIFAGSFFIIAMNFKSKSKRAKNE
ncbi:MAG: hypothetical protein ACXQS8_07360 [Candidatus Helarchaeales archaeon]